MREAPVAPLTSASVLRDIEAQTTRLVRRHRRLVREQSRAVHPALTSMAYRVLTVLVDQGPQRATHVCRALAADPGAVSRAVIMLVDLQLVTTAADRDDRRATMLSVTPWGHERVAAVRTAMRAHWARTLDDWSEPELMALVRGLARFNEATAGS